MQNEVIERGEQLRERLTRRYVLALAIVAGVLVLAFITLTAQLQKNELDAWLINVSGRQRMLSQRTALHTASLAKEIRSNGSPSESTRHQLAESISLMAKSHKALLFDPDGNRRLQTESLKSLYFDPATGVHPLVTNYIDQLKTFYSATAPNFVESASQGEPASDADRSSLSELSTQVIQTARSGDLLGKLDQIVKQYELEAEEKLAQFWKLEIAFLTVGLLTLLCEAFFIFRPIVRSVVESFVSLERANGELLEFSYRISHDLRAPVVSSLGLIEVTQEANQDKDYEEVASSLAHIHRSLNKVSGTIEDIVNLTKLKLAEVPQETFSLEQVIEDAIETATQLAGSNEMTIQRDIQVTEPIVAKKLFVKQSVENLISNAVKYRDPNCTHPKVGISATYEQGECVLRVTDNGLGVPADYREKLFGMFQRFHPRVAFGSGLGLYLVRQNATALSGSVNYTSLEKGSEFKFAFPTGDNGLAV